MSELEDDDNLLDEEDEGDDIDQTYLAFEVGSESYALGVAFVSEIIPMTKIAPVPDTPAYLPGVINLRGRVIPVMSLRRRFGLADEATRPVVVVVQHESTAAGLVVDGVRSVMNFPADTIRRPGRSADESGRPSLIKGIATQGEQLHLVLDPDRLLTETGRSDGPGGAK
ncbi:MAG: purine-binding chemotaxis protein CheW [Deltaproteobacteria bacterium]|jgi:purine-binding chemotaxis protein CheW|nr:purine-binding chemotaxis protein CheW [Deltaproteobacteria bacterium]